MPALIDLRNDGYHRAYWSLLGSFCRVMRCMVALKNLMPDSAYIVLDKLKANLND